LSLENALEDAPDPERVALQSVGHLHLSLAPSQHGCLHVDAKAQAAI